MKRFGYTILAIAAAGLSTVGAGSALAANGPKTLVFTASYAGNASTKVDGNSVAINATGSGKASVIGAGSVTGVGTGDSSQQPCVPFGGTGSIAGASGSIAFKLVTRASGCGDEGGHVFTVKGYAVVTKATGKLAKAKGTLKFTGLYNRDDGTFTVKFAGTLKR